jgi:hypothetical protein
VEDFKLYERTGEVEARPWTADDAHAYANRTFDGPYLVSVSKADHSDALNNVDPRGWLARNVANHADQWYVAANFFAKNYRLAAAK